MSFQSTDMSTKHNSLLMRKLRRQQAGKTRPGRNIPRGGEQNDVSSPTRRCQCFGELLRSSHSLTSYHSPGRTPLVLVHAFDRGQPVKSHEIPASPKRGSDSLAIICSGCCLVSTTSKAPEHEIFCSALQVRQIFLFILNLPSELHDQMQSFASTPILLYPGGILLCAE